MKESMKPKSKNVTFQISVVWDPINYLSPHLAMKYLKRVDKKKTRHHEAFVYTPLPLPEPRIRQYQTLYKFSRYSVQYSPIILMVGITSLILLLFIYFFVDSKDSFQQEEEQEENEHEEQEEQEKEAKEDKKQEVVEKVEIQEKTKQKQQKQQKKQQQQKNKYKQS